MNVGVQGVDKSTGNTAVTSHYDGEFESCQVEQGLIDELVQPAATILCQSTAVCRTLTIIGIARTSKTMFTKIE